MIALDGRLSALFAEIPSCATLADVGCDHGKLCVKAVAEGVAARAVAVDKSEKCLEKTRILAKKEGVFDKIRFSRSDGASDISQEEADVLVIAGMGGLEIVEILRRKTIDFNVCVFLPHSHAVELRRFLSGRYFVDKDEKICAGGKFYDIIKCREGVGCEKLSQRRIYFGGGDVGDGVFCRYIGERKKLLAKLAVEARNDKIRLEEIQRESDAMEGL